MYLQPNLNNAIRSYYFFLVNYQVIFQHLYPSRKVILPTLLYCFFTKALQDLVILLKGSELVILGTGVRTKLALISKSVCLTIIILTHKTVTIHLYKNSCGSVRVKKRTTSKEDHLDTSTSDTFPLPFSRLTPLLQFCHIYKSTLTSINK